MTSAEFVRKYRLLKLVAERGARSHIAQEISLGRMVMVHRLEVGTPAEREHLLARARSLDPAAAAKIFTIDEVDGVSVIITHFLASFTDLPTWLDQGAGPEVASQERGATAVPATSVPASAPPTSIPNPPTAAPAPGEFTRIFQAGMTPTSQPASPPPRQASTPPQPIATPPQPMAPLPPAATPPAQPTPIASQPAPPSGPGSFTSVFGKLPVESHSTPVTPATPALPTTPTVPKSNLPKMPEAPRFESVMPPVDFSAPPPRTPAPEIKPVDQPAPGDFTQLFSRLDAQQKAGAVPPTPPAPPSASLPSAPAFVRDPASLASEPPSMRPAAPPPFQAPSAPPIAANAGPSEFTRVLGRVTPHGPSGQSPSAASSSAPAGMSGGGVPRPNLPPPQALQPPAFQMPGFQAPGMPAVPQTPALPAAPVPAPPPPPAASPTKSVVPLIIAGNIVVILVIVIVFLVMRK